MNKLHNISQFLEGFRDAAFVIDEKSVVTSWNKAASKLYMLSAKDVLGKHLDEIIPIDESFATLDNIRKEIAIKGSWWGKVQHSSTTKEKFVVNWNAAACVSDDSDTHIMVFATPNENIMHGNSKAVPAVESWQNLISNIPGLLLVLDRSDDISFINREMKENYTDQLVGQSVFSIFDPHYRKKVESAIRVAREKNLDTRLVLPLDRKDGSIIWYECHVCRRNSELPNEEIIIMATDVTTQKQVECDLLQSETLFRTIFEGSTLGMFATDLDGRIVKTNESLENMLGYSSCELLGKNIWSLTSEDDRSNERILVNEVIQKNKRYVQFEKKYLHKDGSKIWAELTISIAEDSDKKFSFLVGLTKNINKYKKAEIEKANLEEKYYELFETIESGVVIYSAVNNGEDFIIVGFNRAAEKIERMDRSDALGKKVTEVFSTIEDYGLLDVFRHVYNTGETVSYPVKLYKDNRIEGWRKNLVYKLRTGEVVAVYDDISERKKVELQLIENEEMFRAVFETAVDAIFVKDKARRYIRVNPAMLELHSLKATDMLGKTDSEIFGQETDWQESGEDLKVLDGKVLVGEPTRKVNNKRHTFHTVKVPYANGEGEIVGLCGIARDITEWINNEQELKDQKEKFRSLTENSTDYVIRFDDKARHVYVNPAASLGYNLDSNKVIGKTHREIGVEEQLCQLWEESIGKVFDTGETLEEIVEFDEKSFHKWLDWRLIPEYDKHSRITTVLAVSRDITPVKLAEQEKTVLEEQLRQSQKMEAIGQLAGGVAHDFNNLLTTIEGNIALAKMEASDADPITEMLDEVSFASQRAADLTRQLLAFSRKQIIEPRILNLNDMINGLYKLLVRIIGEDVQLEIKPAKNLGNVKADPGQIEQIIVNLAVNARDAMPNGGKLVVETHVIDLDKEYSSNHPYSSMGSNIMLAVSDTGHGMDGETSRHIFDPFFTTKEKGQGTGLGLSTVYGIVKQHGGSIEVYSEIGSGTTFKIYFPHVKDEAENIERDDDQQVIPEGKEHILVVEDEQVVRMMTSKILTRLGYTVCEAASGREAVELFVKKKDTIDLLITDVIMPNMNGWDLAQQLLSIKPETKILFTSGYTDNVIAHHGVLGEDVNFIGKPFSPVALGVKIRDVLDDDT